MKTAWFLLMVILSTAPAMGESSIREFSDHVVVEINGDSSDKHQNGTRKNVDERAERIAWLEGELGRLRREVLMIRSGQPGETPEDTQYRLNRRDELTNEINHYNAELILLKNGQPTSDVGAEKQP